MDANEGVEGIFAFLADENVEEDARLLVGEEREGEAEVKSGDELKNYVDKDEADDDNWALKETKSVEDLIWVKLCKDISILPPNRVIEELETLSNNGTRHRR